MTRLRYFRLVVVACAYRVNLRRYCFACDLCVWAWHPRHSCRPPVEVDQALFDFLAAIREDVNDG